MKSKNKLLIISFFVYNTIVLIISLKYSMSILFCICITLYILLGTIYLNLPKDSCDKNSSQLASSTATFEKKKNEEIKQKSSFKDVAGLEEIKDELLDIIDFINNSDKYDKMGAKVPRGILLYGPPGTGKTLLAKAVAGESNSSFIYSSGSEFVEKYVGVGAKRIRSLFERARKEAPCIVFIDEVDALGSKRNSESNNEKDQTLNQFLVELDGFKNSNTVVVIGATNRLDLLDEAMLRPGRFDRKIYVGNPNYNSRVKILEVHTHNKPLEKDVNIKKLAKKTHGLSGAQLANIANEAALRAIKIKNKKVTQNNFNYAIEKIVAGLEVKNSTVSDKEKRIVAFHESGHAVAAKILDIDKIQKISIVPRNKALGYVLKFPDEDKYLYTKQELLYKITILLSGRAAEEIFFKEISTGASNDIKEATELAYELICKYGMSNRLGNLYISEYEFKYYANSIKSEAKKIIDDSYKNSLTLLQSNLTLTTKIANHLIENENIDSNMLNSIFSEFTLEPAL